MPSSACQKCARSEEHTSELQPHDNIVCRLLLEKKTNLFLLTTTFKVPQRQVVGKPASIQQPSNLGELYTLWLSTTFFFRIIQTHPNHPFLPLADPFHL